MSDAEFIIVFVFMSVIVGVVLSTLIPTLITILLVCMIAYFIVCICNSMTNTLYNNQPTNIYYATPQIKLTQSADQITVDAASINSMCSYISKMTDVFGSKNNQLINI